jgi:hypothetical protein
MWGIDLLFTVVYLCVWLREIPGPFVLVNCMKIQSLSQVWVDCEIRSSCDGDCEEYCLWGCDGCITWRWRQQGLSKCWQVLVRLLSITLQNKKYFVIGLGPQVCLNWPLKCSCRVTEIVLLIHLIRQGSWGLPGPLAVVARLELAHWYTGKYCLYVSDM